MKNWLFLMLFLFVCSPSIAEKALNFAIVPQQSASTLAKLWTPIIEEISKQSGLNIHFTTAPDIPTFEKRLAAGEYDIAYMNPYHYVVFNQSVGYQAIAKARDKQIKGIIVVPKKGKVKTLKDLQNSTLAFPAPAAFAATILTQSDLSAQQVNFTANYVSSHDSVYRSVAKGIYPGGGGVLRTFNNVAPQIRDQLRILWTTKGYTPHAIAIHPRITAKESLKLQQALLNMEQSVVGKALLNSIKIYGFENAIDTDWDDIRALQLKPLSDN